MLVATDQRLAQAADVHIDRALNKVALAQAPSAALPAVQLSPLIGGPMDIFSASIRCCQKGGYTC